MQHRLISKFNKKHNHAMSLITTLVEGTFEDKYSYEYLGKFLLNLNNIYGPTVLEFKNPCHNDYNLVEINYRSNSASCAHMLISLSTHYDFRAITILENINEDFFNHPRLILGNIEKVKETNPEIKDKFFYHTSTARFIDLITHYQEKYYNKMPDIV